MGMCSLRLLQFDALLLTIWIRAVVIVPLGLIAIVRALLLGWRRVRWCGLIILVVVIGLGVLLVLTSLAGAGHPACAVVGLATGFAATTGCYARADDEEEKESNDDEHGNEPADPTVPGVPVAGDSSPITIVASSHVFSLEWDGMKKLMSSRSRADDDGRTLV